MSDTQVYVPKKQVLLGTASHLCQSYTLNLNSQRFAGMMPERRKRIFIEVMKSDRKVEASREGSKLRMYGT